MKPDYLQFYPTLRCNYSCRFCFNKGLTARKDVRPEDFDLLASIAAQQGIGHIDLLGGEPTLHPGLSGLIESLHTRNIKTTLSSNGSDVKQLEALFERYGESTLCIGISLNDLHVPGQLHDFILACQPMVKSLFSKKGPIPPVCEPYAKHPGIDYFLLYQDAMEDGDLADTLAFDDFFSAINRLKDEYPRFEGVFCSGFVPDTQAHPALAHVRCPAGTTKLSVLPDGSVYPCYLFFKYAAFELGNIFKDDFHKIWHHPTLDFFRQFETNQCPKTDCQLFGECHGGCPAMSYRFYNDVGGPDPRCISPAG